ncbi:L-rhamnose mutarotase [Danxiaibacter flavus]|uniref:L-rhamnose mutarotase n=1 Tax=Danxiaibacter flavus TaxID=3049108 RepID=A0ABV3ZM22_9BACT|nr:L-rhamnose mutarotase [Chitinophagaceae bacterium DXS]
MQTYKYRSFKAVMFVLLITLCSCKHKEKTVINESVKTKELVFVVNLVEDDKKVQEYLNYHKNIWPEVEAGFRKAGYQQITLYRFNRLLVMRIVVPENADLDSMGRIAEGYDKRCAEWNKLMSGYQQGVLGTAPGQTWVEAKPFYSFSNK